MSPEDSNKALIRLDGSELANPECAQNEIVSEMVSVSLVLAKACELSDLNELVRRASELLDKDGEPMCPRNIQAFSLFLRAASAGHAYAQYRVSACYRKGEGVAEDAIEAGRWLQKSASAESLPALWALAFALQSGTRYKTIHKDETEAIAVFSRLAALGCSGACVQIAEIYKPRADISRCLHWHKEAALRGNRDAVYEVCEFYAKQLGTFALKTECGDHADAYAWNKFALIAGASVDDKRAKYLALGTDIDASLAERIYKLLTKERNDWANRFPERCNFR